MTSSIIVREIDFVIPDFDTAKRVFQQGMQLKLEYEGTQALFFRLNNETRLQCWLPRPRTGIWGKRIRLYCPTEKILYAAKKLASGPDRVDLRDQVNDNGEKFYLLQISTPKIYSTIVLSDKSFT